MEQKQKMIFISKIIVVICVFMGLISYVWLRQATTDMVNRAEGQIRFIDVDCGGSEDCIGTMSTHAIEFCKSYFSMRNNLFPSERGGYDAECLDIICEYDDLDKCAQYHTFIEKQINIFGIKA